MWKIHNVKKKNTCQILMLLKKQKLGWGQACHPCSTNPTHLLLSVSDIAEYLAICLSNLDRLILLSSTSFRKVQHYSYKQSFCRSLFQPVGLKFGMDVHHKKGFYHCKCKQSSSHYNRAKFVEFLKSSC